jgi:hypothetical protein
MLPTVFQAQLPRVCPESERLEARATLSPRRGSRDVPLDRLRQVSAFVFATRCQDGSAGTWRPALELAVYFGRLWVVHYQPPIDRRRIADVERRAFGGSWMARM